MMESKIIGKIIKSRHKAEQIKPTQFHYPSDDNYNNLNEYSRYKKPYFNDRTSKKRPASYSIANLKSTEKANSNPKDHILAKFEKDTKELIDKRLIKNKGKTGIQKLLEERHKRREEQKLKEAYMSDSKHAEEENKVKKVLSAESREKPKPKPNNIEQKYKKRSRDTRKPSISRPSQLL